MKLKTLFENKAQEDRTQIAGFIKEITESSDLISDDEIKTYCDNLFNLDFIALRTIDEEVN